MEYARYRDVLETADKYGRFVTRNSVLAAAVFGIFPRVQLDFIIVIVVADIFQVLGRNRNGTGNGNLQGAFLLQPADFLAFFVMEIVGHFLGHLDLNAGNVFVMGGQLQHAHDVDTHAFAGFHLAGTEAVRTILVDATLEGGANALAGHFDNAEGGNLENLGASAIALDRLAQGAFDATAMVFLAHVDEVVDDDAAQVAEAELAGNFLGRK